MRIVWTKEARDQKETIWQFLAEHDLPYADRVEQRLDTRIGQLVTAPRQGRPAPADLRLLSIPDVQYVVAYRIEDDVIRIMRLYSTAQRQ